MNDPQGYYEKFRVERVDGKPIDGRTFTLLIDSDPFAKVALRAYRDAVAETDPSHPLVADLDAMLAL